jgi:hypothetical protein
MTPSRVPLALVLVMVAVLLAAGCAGDNIRILPFRDNTGFRDVFV